MFWLNKEKVNILKTILPAFIFIIFASCNSQKNVGDNYTNVLRMYESYKDSFSKAPEITVREVLTLSRTKKVCFIDIRDPKEIEVSKIPNAITAKEFENKKNKLKDQLLVAYCTIGYRSGIYAEKRSTHGLKVYNLKGGILAWIHNGQKIVNDKGETKKVHVYGKKWNLAPESFKTVW